MSFEIYAGEQEWPTEADQATTFFGVCVMHGIKTRTDTIIGGGNFHGGFADLGCPIDVYSEDIPQPWILKI
jgi:hypothetical protein